MNQFGLPSQTFDKINLLFGKLNFIERVIIYGSRAKGNYREGSDIDLTLIGDNLNHQNLSELKTQIDDLNTPYLFDISILNKIKSEDLKEHIKRVGKVFYDRI